MYSFKAFLTQKSAPWKDSFTVFITKIIKQDSLYLLGFSSFFFFWLDASGLDAQCAKVSSQLMGLSRGPSGVCGWPSCCHRYV